MPATVFIDGEAGTTGLQIFDRLNARSDIELIRLDDARRKDTTARREALQAADVAILCLPDAAAKEAVALIGNAPTRVIDAATAHRVDPTWVYGFPEMVPDQAQKVAEAARVANPGCYPTGAIALIRPLRDAGIISADARLNVSAVSGYTGGGKALIAEYDAGEAPDHFVYGLTQTHKHLPELTLYTQLDHRPTFVPAVGNFAQGMAVQVPLHLDTLPGSPTLEDIHATLTAHYAGAAHVRVAPMADTPSRIDPQAMNGTNDMTLHVAGNPDSRTAILVAVLDNLGKGASGAAVQNLDLMLGL